MRNLVLAVIAAVLFVAPVRAAEDCHLYRVAALDMEFIGAGVVVPVAVGDHPLHMVVDTGGYLTALTEDAAKALGLFVETRPDSGMTIYGGIPLRRFATVSGFTLGKMKARSLSYPLLPAGFLPPGVDGLLAPDFLANFDLDFDFANGKVSLFSRDHCDGKVGWWTTEDQLTVIPIRREEDNVHISMHVMLDGKDVKALIDTGASRTLMSLETARDLFDIKDSDLRDAPGVNNIQGAKKVAFKKMSFGGVEVSNPDITLIPDRKAHLGPRAPDLILGIGILRQLHLYIAYREKKLYLTAASVHR
jgi:predicted aspartyl protease